MKIKAVVFDIGGILELTPRTDWQTKWERSLKFQPGQLDQQLKPLWLAGSVGQLSEHQVNAAIATTLNLEMAVVSSLMNDIWSEYLGTANVELISFVRSLRLSYRTALLSNSFVGAREREEECYQYSQLCEAIIYSHEVGVQKPDTKIFQITCDRLSLSPAEILFLDDNEENVIAARNFGMNSIHFRENRQAIHEVLTALGSSPFTL